MGCPGCGRANPGDARLCTACGAPLGDTHAPVLREALATRGDPAAAAQTAANVAAILTGARDGG